MGKKWTYRLKTEETGKENNSTDLWDAK